MVQVRSDSFDIKKMQPLKSVLLLLAALFLFPILFSCVSSRISDEEGFDDENVFGEMSFDESPASEITLLFAGDVMAHEENFSMKGYRKIWEGVYSETKDCDIAFANIEAPVDNSRPYESYPTFNMHSDYVDEVINAGFSVFSLVNNHTNDQGLGGIKSTLLWANEIHEKTKSTDNPIYFSGLKASPDDAFSFCLIEKDGWRILFVAVTEIMNAPNYKSYLNYVPYTADGRKKFAEYIKGVREENPCDVFVASIHTNEEEYVADVKQTRREYYAMLLENGVDVIWANHPHIIREREIYGDEATGSMRKIVMYGNGNTVSGQRRQPQLENPMNAREDRGDGVMMRVTFSKNTASQDEKNVIIAKHEPVYITTYINEDVEFVIKKLDGTFVQELKDAGRGKWASYIQSRMKKAENTKETIIWE